MDLTANLLAWLAMACALASFGANRRRTRAARAWFDVTDQLMREGISQELAMRIVRGTDADPEIRRWARWQTATALFAMGLICAATLIRVGQVFVT